MKLTSSTSRIFSWVLFASLSINSSAALAKEPSIAADMMTAVRAAVLVFNTVSATDQGCPYQPTSSSVLLLKQTEYGILSDAKDKQKQCVDAINGVIKSVQNNDFLRQNTADPALSLKQQRDSLVQQLLILVDQKPPKTDQIVSVQQNIHDIDIKIQHMPTADMIAKRDAARIQLVNLGSSLLDTYTSMAEGNPECRKIAKSNGNWIATTGLGLLSVASPLLFSAGIAGGVSDGLTYLGKLVRLFNSSKKDMVTQLDERDQTLTLACLYHGIMSATCSNFSTVEDQTRYQTSLDKQVACIPDNLVYRDLKIFQRDAADMATQLSAIALSDPNSLDGDFGGLNLKEKIGAQIGNMVGSAAALSTGAPPSPAVGSTPGGGANAASTPVNIDALKAEHYRNERKLIESVLGDNPEVPFDQMSAVDQPKFQTLVTGHNKTMVEWMNGIGMTPIQTFEGRGPPLQWADMYRANREGFRKALESHLVAVYPSSLLATGQPIAQIWSRLSNTKLSRQIDSAADLFRRLDKVTDARVEIAEKEHKPGSSEMRKDQKHLNELVKNARTLILGVKDWLRADETTALGRATIVNGPAELLKFFGKTPATIDQAKLVSMITEATIAPISKFLQIQSQERADNKPKVADSPLNVDGPDQNTAPTPFERYTSLQDAYQVVRDLHPMSDADGAALEKTRTSFEDAGQLGGDFKKGLKSMILDMIKKMSEGRDQSKEQRLVTLLCGLSTSMPGGGNGKPSVSECLNPLPGQDKTVTLMPKRMSGYKGATRPGCEYMQYFSDKTREDNLRRNTDLPSPDLSQD